MNPNVYSLWSQTPLSLGYITKACSLIGQFTCTLQKLCLEMAFFKNFKYVFWRLQTRCLKFENCFGITGLILLKWDTVQHDPSLGEKVEFPLVTDLWPRWPNKHVVWRQVRRSKGRLSGLRQFSSLNLNLLQLLLNIPETWENLHLVMYIWHTFSIPLDKIVLWRGMSCTRNYPLPPDLYEQGYSKSNFQDKD